MDEFGGTPGAAATLSNEGNTRSGGSLAALLRLLPFNLPFLRSIESSTFQTDICRRMHSDLSRRDRIFLDKIFLGRRGWSCWLKFLILIGSCDEEFCFQISLFVGLYKSCFLVIRNYYRFKSGDPASLFYYLARYP